MEREPWNCHVPRILIDVFTIESAIIAYCRACLHLKVQRKIYSKRNGMAYEEENSNITIAYLSQS